MKTTNLTKHTLKLAIKSLQKEKQFITGRLNHLKGQKDKYSNTTALRDLNMRIYTFEIKVDEYTQAIDELKEETK